MRKHGIVVSAAMTLWAGVAFGQAAPGGAPAAPPAPVGKAGYFANCKGHDHILTVVSRERPSLCVSIR